MRKVHYKVVLNMSTTEGDLTNGLSTLKCLNFWPEHTLVEDNNNFVDIKGVETESVEIVDSSPSIKVRIE